MKGEINLQTNDLEKLVCLESAYRVQGYFTFLLQVRSGAFRGKSSLCASRAQLETFAEEIRNLDENLKGCAILNDNDSDAFIILEGVGFGRIAVAGQVGGTHQDQFLRFKFETDQTVLGPFWKQICEMLSEFDGNATALSGNSPVSNLQ